MFVTKSTAALLFGALTLSVSTSSVFARDQINIVGSSTVFPFATAVAERFGKNTDFKTPVVESTGSGGGLKLFCQGVGENTPDITNASRRIKASEVKLCAENGIADIVEVKVGYDGIVLANSRNAELMNITRKDIFLALAKNVPNGEGKTMPNPYENWSQINPSLPNVKIEVLGPPPTSGTRDAFVELAMEGGCKAVDWVKALKKADKSAYKALCHTMREDGAFIEAGENDNLIVQKLEANPAAFGIFGYSFLDQNSDKVQGSSIGGLAPTFENIADGKYPVSRSLFFYVKKAHIGVTPGIEAYLAEFLSDDAAGEDGYLADKGLIPMTAGEAAEWKAKVKNLENLSM
ncbi:MAG: PstS family phosphate ABC transporter substrate-binding protein [Nitratireductor sp.]